MMFIFAGCGNMPDLSDENNDIIAEYVAGVLIDRSNVRQAKYIESKEIETSTLPDETESSDETTSENETESQGEGETETETVPAEPDYLDVSDLFGVDNLKVTLDSCVICSEYPFDDAAIFTFSPEPGCRLVAVTLNIHNSNEQAVTLSSKNRIMKCQINTDASINSNAMIFGNDITNLKDVVLEPGADYKGLVLFMFKEDLVTQPVDMDVYYNTSVEDTKVNMHIPKSFVIDGDK